MIFLKPRFEVELREKEMEFGTKGPEGTVDFL